MTTLTPIRTDKRTGSSTSHAFKKIAASLSGLSCAMSGLIVTALPAEASNSAQTATAVFQKIESSSNPQAAYSSLSAKDRAAFDNYYLLANSKVTYEVTKMDAGGSPVGETLSFASEDEAMAAVASTSSCWAANVKNVGRANAGNEIFSTYTEGSWCSSGGRVTSTSFGRTWSTVKMIGWRDAGQLGAGNGISGGEARIWGQRKMVLGAGGWDIQTKQPCTRVNGGRTGMYSMSLVCSVY